ncbi:hypothetical protein QJS10_CPB17g00590 [Acorus calamus]|uniref:Terpene synthase N-terminal domain-containing protein n=1 Tax=Acorus calamus TaxID=4465 RepID=A0AAV9CRC3_ACOCL|nr:hypothetical protein QJS10_CPB17g00590 [Acorus calamus]
MVKCMFRVSEPLLKLKLIDDLQRLGLAYHFKEEIRGALADMEGNVAYDKDDLYATALYFRLLRQYGFTVSQDSNYQEDPYVISSKTFKRMTEMDRMQDAINNSCNISKGKMKKTYENKETLQHLDTSSDLIRLPSMIFRLRNDLATSKMWKKLNKMGCTPSPFPQTYIVVVFDLARMSECFYHYGDGLGAPDAKLMGSADLLLKYVVIRISRQWACTQTPLTTGVVLVKETPTQDVKGLNEVPFRSPWYNASSLPPAGDGGRVSRELYLTKIELETKESPTLDSKKL